jgi:hypothetical protein
MLKNFKVELLKKVELSYGSSIKVHEFNKRDERLFYVVEYESPEDEDDEECDSCYTAIELVPDEGELLNRPGTRYTVKPVYIYCRDSDDEDRIIKVVPIEEAFGGSILFIHYILRPLYLNFSLEVHNYVEYDRILFVNFLKQLLDDYTEDATPHYIHKESNKVEFRVLEVYNFKGYFTFEDGIVTANIKLLDVYAKKLIMKMPSIQIEGIEDFSVFLSNMSKEDMREYILSSIKMIGEV